MKACIYVEKHVVCAVVGVLLFIPPHLFHFKLDTSSSFSLIVSNGVKRSNTIKLIRWIGKDTTRLACYTAAASSLLMFWAVKVLFDRMKGL